MCQPPSPTAVREKLGTSVPEEITVEKVQPVLNLRPQRIYRVDLSDGTRLHLVTPPYSKWRPLRSDQGMVLSETIAVRWIKERAAASFFPSSPSPSSSSPSAKQEKEPTENEGKEEEKEDEGGDPDETNFWYTFYAPTPGAPLLSLLAPASQQGAARNLDRATINSQLGKLHGRLASFTSPTGRFGPVAATIPPPIGTTTPPPSSSGPSFHRQQQQHLGAAGGLFGTVGAASWSVAFHSMLEGSLRDGEDMAVVLSYPTIRRHYRRLGYLLDEVRVPRLVVVDGGDESNVLVEGVPVEEEEEKKEWKVRGLRDWSSCVFGDPLLGVAFSDPGLEPGAQPAQAFLDGFNGEGKNTTNAPLSYPLNLNPSLIEGVETAWVRLLLYQVFHAVARIVAEFYRPRADSGARELEARRRLNIVLAKLAEVPDDVKGGGARKKHARPSGEMSPAKRLRALPAPEGSSFSSSS
ncbi:hypothetical protein QBC44DRAFT_240943 [Cladorrhinum sp. PSN332]|nr:hypothetical protein QBC44DRAFT_240943 [Cladorrhinum sp. PSN332]